MAASLEMMLTDQEESGRQRTGARRKTAFAACALDELTMMKIQSIDLSSRTETGQLSRRRFLVIVVTQ
jgi:hypothetical protein